MHLVKIDVIHLQPAQTRLDFRHDMPARESDLIRPHRLADKNVRVEANFCSDDQIFSPLAKNSPENFLRRTCRINVRSVKEIAANLDKPIENFSCSFFVCFSSKRHASKAKLGNFEPSTA